MKNISDSTIISKALDEGLDLREFSSELNKNLEEKEKESVETFLSNTEEALDLHMRVEKYDAILEQVENMLTGFQENLGGLSREIRHLQDQSTSMGVKLGNRKSVRHYLSQMVDELVVPEEMISIICSGNLADQSYMEQLHQLQRKIKFAREQRFHHHCNYS
jgi:intergrase/recombinase